MDTTVTHINYKVGGVWEDMEGRAARTLWTNNEYATLWVGSVPRPSQCCLGQCGPSNVPQVQTNFSCAIYSTQDSI